MNRQPLANLACPLGFNTSRQSLDPELQGFSNIGSINNLLLGNGFSVPFGGYSAKSGYGTRISLQIGNTYGGIRDNGGTNGAGSLFEDVGRSIWGIGAGIATKEGSDISGLTLSSTLQVSLAVAGVYGGGTTYQAGLGQPSAPDVGIPSATGAGYTGLINGTVSIKLVRLRLSTGGASRPSTTSAVVSPSAKTIRITFPSASSGQDYWAVFATQQGFGGVGLHYRLPYNGSLDISETTVNAGTIDSIARTLEFDFQDGDLSTDSAEISYIDNYPPPAGTHAVRLENVMNVIGCYADSSSSPTSTSTGTCIAVSLPNFYESYKPKHLLFLPEQVVSVLSRSTDNYAWIGCKNSILTLQYIGLSDNPACSVTTAFPNIGVAYHHNWCQVYGRICAFTSKGNLVLLTENGELDDSFAAPIKKYIKGWLTSETFVGFDSQTNCIVVFNNKTSFAFCLHNQRWSDPCFLDDAGISGTFLSCVTSEGKLIVTVNNGGTHTAYDYNTGASSMPIAKVTHWKSEGGIKNLYELEVAVNASKTTHPVAIALQKNLRPIASRSASMTSGSNAVTLSESILNSTHVGDKVFIYGTDIGGSGIHFLTGKIGSLNSALSFNLLTVAGSTLNASASFSKCYVLFGQYIKTVTISNTGEQQFANLFPTVQEARSFALGVWQMSDASTGEFINAVVSGTGGSAVAAR